MIIIDVDGAERSWRWVEAKYNLPLINMIPKDRDHWEVIELHEQIGNTSMTVRVLSLSGKALEGVRVKINWPDGEVEQKTNKEGHTGFGMGVGSYYRPDRGERGPHEIWIPDALSDTIRGLGMVGKTNHAHLEPIFQFIKGGIVPPPADCEEYISALERIREIVDGILPVQK